MESQTPYFSPFLPVFINLIRYFIFAGLAFLLVYKVFNYKFLKNKIQKRIAKNTDFLREIKNSIFSTVIFGLVGFVLINSSIGEHTKIYRNISDFSIWWLPLSGILMLIIQDTYFYWVHRAIHSPKVFKYIHRVHHQSINPSPWASYSFHFSEAIIEALIFPIMLFIIPLHPLVIFSFTFVAFLFNVYGHLGFEIVPKWFRYSWLFEIFNTSVHHNLHHEKFKGNYGLYFRFWDRVMNTENPNYVKVFDKVQEQRFGGKTIYLIN
ncbi:sterol desaturase family protein [Bernardetia sp.]|uniref:sterol desaturase family protein n=1 Tax=Bernardetia sp. TaxID=1937974 RepID=UPI0025C49153|nr:sterol desaturase family protein [Bernardetia sp.]